MLVGTFCHLCNKYYSKMTNEALFSGRSRLSTVVFGLLAVFGIVWVAFFAGFPNSEQSALFFCRAQKKYCYDFFTNKAVSCMPSPYIDVTTCNMVDSKKVCRCDQCYPPLANYWVGLFPESFAGALSCTLIGVLFFIFGFFVFVDRYVPRQRLISIAAICSSAPFLFAVTLSNLILYAVGCSLVFFAWHDSNSRVRKFVAAIALAVAAVLKITPALLGLLYLGRGWRTRIGYAVLSGCAAAFLFAVPFAFCGGTEAFRAWLENAAMNSSGYGYLNCFGLYGIVTLLVQSFTMRQLPLVALEVLRTVSSCFGIFVLIRGCVCDDGSWKRGVSVALGMHFIPPTMMYYTALYVVPFAITGIFHADKRIRRSSVAYFISQCILLRIPLFLGPPGSLNAVFAAAASIDMAFVLLAIAWETRSRRRLAGS